MIRKVFFFLAVTIGLFSCTKPASKFIVSGEIDGLENNEIVYLYDNSKKANTDSVETKGGSFSFEGSVEFPSFFYIVVRREDGDVRYKGLWIENSEISFIGSIDNLSDAVITGSEMQKQDDKYNAQVKSIHDELDGLYEQYDPGNKELTAIIEVMIDSLTILENKEKVIFIKANPESTYSTYLAKRVVRSISPEEGQEVYASLSDAQKQSKNGLSIKEYLDLNKYLSIGDAYVEISLPNSKGEIISLSSFEGKYILIDFWASWCGPCRKESPHLRKAFTQFNSKGFEIYAVSVDEDKDKWLDAVAEDNMVWTSVIAEGAFDSKSAMMYGVKYIPFNYLIGPDGKIVEMHLRGEALLEKLKELLGE